MIYMLGAPKIKVFYTELGILDFDPSINTGDLPGFVGGCRIHIGLVDVKSITNCAHETGNAPTFVLLPLLNLAPVSFLTSRTTFLRPLSSFGTEA